MEKMMWTKPMAVAEQFMPNEYISVCFSISCDYGEAGDRVGSMQHRQSGCGNPANQSVTVYKGSFDDPNNVCEIGITEHNVKLMGFIPVGDRTAYFINPTDAATAPGPGAERISTSANNIIYWVTDVETGWMVHKGTINYNDANRPKHS